MSMISVNAFLYEVLDLVYVDCFYRWSNKKEGDSFQAKKLDGVKGTMGWLEKFNQVGMELSNLGISDHFPVVMSIENEQSFRPKSF